MNGHPFSIAGPEAVRPRGLAPVALTLTLLLSVGGVAVAQEGLAPTTPPAQPVTDVPTSTAPTARTGTTGATSTTGPSTTEVGRGVVGVTVDPDTGLARATVDCRPGQANQSVLVPPGVTRVVIVTPATCCCYPDAGSARADLKRMASGLVQSRSDIREAYCKNEWDIDFAGDEAQQLQLYCYERETLRAYGEQVGSVLAGAGRLEGP